MIKHWRKKSFREFADLKKHSMSSASKCSHEEPFQSVTLSQQITTTTTTASFGVLFNVHVNGSKRLISNGGTIIKALQSKKSTTGV